ncbi:MAG: type II secretion system minor pseudopilin GspI [Nitrococcus sp.]|nr:type II secretion system minor pseudopilin GspI [Nitrococcus sp.]
MARSPYNACNEHGFTLIEVLVAVAVLAIALGALIQAASESSAGVAWLRDRTFSHWVAMNELTSMQLRDVWNTGEQDSRRRFAGREWPVHVEIRETSYPQLRRADVSVYDPEDEEQSLSRVTGLLRKPPEAGLQGGATSIPAPPRAGGSGG